MMNKILSIEEAVNSLDDYSFCLAFRGHTLYRRPMGFALALFQKYQKTENPSEVSLLSFTAGLESDILIDAGMISSVRTCYFGLETFGLAPQYTKAANSGQIQIIEESEASIANGLRATMAGIGFMPSTAWQGPVMLELRPDVKSVKDPYTSEILTAFPTITCDVAIIHTLEVDMDGNADIGFHKGIDPELSLVAARVIVTSERIIADIPPTDIISLSVDTIVELPGGAWPTSCHPLYPFDANNILECTSLKE